VMSAEGLAPVPGGPGSSLSHGRQHSAPTARRATAAGADAAATRAGAGAGLDAAALRRAWREASHVGGWSRPRDWWAPEVDAVVEAVWDRRDVVEACARLGRVRGEAGVGMTETLDDLCALYAALPSGVPPLRALRALVGAWADAGVAPLRTATCEDPLSGLASAVYLRTRLAELYREVERAGGTAPLRHGLVVVPIGVPSGARWDGLLRRLALGEALRSVFSGGETLAVIGPGAVVGLVERDPQLHGRLSALRRRLGEIMDLGWLPRVWLERLPETLPAAYDLLEDLAR